MSFNDGLTGEQFSDHVDFLVEYFGLRPDLPELKMLKDHPDEFVRMLADPMAFLQTLNPQRGVRRLDAQRFEIMSSGALQSWSLARYHIPGLDVRMKRVIADANGVLLDAGVYGQAMILDGSVGNTDMADSRRRAQKAAAIVREFTDVLLDARKLACEPVEVTLTRKSPRRWDISVKQLEAAG